MEEPLLVDIEEAARILSDTVDNLYRTWPQLPFAMKYGKKRIRFSVDGMKMYIEQQLKEKANGDISHTHDV